MAVPARDALWTLDRDSPTVTSKSNDTMELSGSWKPSQLHSIGLKVWAVEEMDGQKEVRTSQGCRDGLTEGG